ncbi:hypothetical protein SADUNF_Sadunf12G0090600 [Salix dunnii]|uniref:AAA+ ATPase domain-containing protein n=1 Tax=Salix dunnii TaxID=1413687 RepID=A0A835JNN7_9ROSI|nr:hypothetical protein SADUNF_Sadunf12G0090600 [Salix dunnii]
MAEPLISLLLEQLTMVLSRKVQKEVNLVVGVKKQVNKLKSNLIDIQSVLEDAERKQVKDKAVRVWLNKLKDVCYDMDDVLDEWSTAILTWEMDEENTRSLKKMRCSFMRSPCFCLNQGVRRRDIALKIKAVTEKLDEIAKEKVMYGFELYEAADHELPRLTSTSHVDDSSVWGRDDEKKSVVSMLLAENSQEARNVDVISLVGLGGIGKTTLAQLAFKDAEVTAHFEKKIWVCVSEPFDEVRIAKLILNQLEVSTSNLDDLQSLLPKVSQSINGIRVLLVLDDVWTEDDRQWEQLKLSLTGCARGSKILVTTRNGAVAVTMGTDHLIDIGPLSDDVCRSIFNHVAFKKRSKDERERLTDIGNQIADKCKGLPLAAKVLGGLMQSKRTREEWEAVLSSELWRLDEVDQDQVEKKLFLPLLLSYYDLPSVVTGSRDMEVDGEHYFQVLAARSFFLDIKKYGREDTRFKMHDIVHDFAQYMEENECLTVDDNNLGEATIETSIERVRHLSMMLSRESSFPSSIHRSKGLRSLFIGNTSGSWLGDALPDVMKQFTCIRSLNLSESSIKEIPKEIGKLIHLRHLNLEGCRQLESLPEIMCDLCNLQSLDVSRCTFLNELPRAIVKLIKLRHLCIYDSCVAFIPKGIERLTCLRTLDWFLVCGGGENESKAANIRELRNLNHIGGSLVIRNLQGGIKDAEGANLKNKHLLCLELHFCVNHEDFILIEVLQPTSHLERLSINGYGGTILPNWMMALTRLQELQLRYCQNVEVLPPLGRLPNLESLVLFRVGVRRLDGGFVGIEEVENANINEGEIARVTAFPKLKTLQIWGLHEVEEWDGIERRVGEEDSTTTSILIMPQLCDLSIKECPLLRAIPDYVLAAPLQKLHVEGCPNLRERYMGEDWHKISHIPSIYFPRGQTPLETLCFVMTRSGPRRVLRLAQDFSHPTRLSRVSFNVKCFLCLTSLFWYPTPIGARRGEPSSGCEETSRQTNIQFVLEDAERKQVKDKAIRGWLDKLKDVCYDMDDVLDEWSTAILTWEMGVRCRDITLKIKAVSEKLDEISKEKGMYGFELYKVADHDLSRLTSTSLVDESSVCGQDDEKKIIISMLLDESSQEARDRDVISLVGLGGIGKTTLAQLAFNDAKVTAHFEKKMWVCVSEPFDGVRIAKVILEQLEVSTSNLDDLQSLLPKFSQFINGIKVLVVLDDVWTEDHRHWEQLKPSLAGCARGSRILVTTRKGAVAAMMGTDHQIDIETLSDDACWSIFNHVAFHKRSKDERERLTDIRNKIANKCKGLPLVAKVLGGLM